jgi:site-specific recombinase XerC
MARGLREAIDEFFLARMPRKHSEHTLAAYRRDLDAISAELTRVLAMAPEQEITLDQLDVAALRRAFASISHQSAATISRTWSTWNQLFDFLVAEQHVTGNPMAAVAKPRMPRSRPKAITGADSVERLLTVASTGRKGARTPWPERDFANIVVLLTCGLRLSELLGLTLRSIEGPHGDRVVGVRGKGSKERPVPIEPEVESVLSA